METKLTLRLDERLISDAKHVARTNGTSLSKMVADYFMRLTAEAGAEPALSPVLSEISGVLKSEQTEEQLIEDYKARFERKHR